MKGNKTRKNYAEAYQGKNYVVVQELTKTMQVYQTNTTFAMYPSLPFLAVETVLQCAPSVLLGFFFFSNWFFEIRDIYVKLNTSWQDIWIPTPCTISLIHLDLFGFSFVFATAGLGLTRCISDCNWGVWLYHNISRNISPSQNQGYGKCYPCAAPRYNKRKPRLFRLQL